LTLAKNPADLSYANLLKELGLGTERELEDLVISAIYAGLVQGSLDPYHKLVLVSSVSPLRDLQPNSIPSMLSTLSAWSTRCSSTLSTLESQIAAIKAAALKRHKAELEWEKHVEKLIEGSNKAPEKLLEEKDLGWAGFGKRGGGRGKRGQGAANGGGELGGHGGGAGEDDDMDVDDEDAEAEDEGDDVKRGKKRGFGSLSFGK
jgi:COP9 signalosome complex subunit 7